MARKLQIIGKFPSESNPESAQSDWSQTDETQYDFIKNKPQPISDMTIEMICEDLGILTGEDGTIITDEDGSVLLI